MASPTRLYKTIAQLILSGLQSGQYLVGDKLPPERELAMQYNVSRPTIREALIVLESKGWIEITKGSGAQIIRTASDGPLVFKDSEVGTFKLLEARRLIEGEVCALAANSISPVEIKHLEQLLKAMNDPDSEIAERADREFHVTIAQATDNEAIVALVETLWDWRYWSASAKQMLVDMVDSGVKDRIVEHRAILRALQSGVSADARKAMRDHLDQVRASLLNRIENAAIEQVRQMNSQRLAYLSDRARSVDT